VSDILNLRIGEDGTRKDSGGGGDENDVVTLQYFIGREESKKIEPL